MIKILFICEHNSARSQMAEAYLNHFADGKMTAESAGLEPGTINPYVVEVMKEEDLDLSDNETQSVFDLYKKGTQYDVIIAVCSPEVGKRCPIFPGRVYRKNWPFDDPSIAVGSDQEKLAYVRKIRDQIKTQVQSFIQEFRQRGYKMFIENNE
jgi:arsenate reductase